MTPTDQPRPDNATAPASSIQKQPAVLSPQSALTRVSAYKRFWLLALVAFVLDQVTKSAIAGRLPFGSYGPGGQIVIVPGLFNLVHVGNTGAAWSMFTGQSVALALVALGTLGAIFFWRRALGLQHGAAQLAFGLLCGGIVGNLVDRLRHGHVIDFLDFHFGNYIYPTFNVADSTIFVGVFWYVVWSLRQPATPAASGK